MSFPKQSIDQALQRLEKLAAAFEFIGNARTAKLIRAEITQIRRDVRNLK